MSDRGKDGTPPGQEERLSNSKRMSPKRARIVRKLQNPEVGYGKPPLASRFKPGQSGNPKGKPKGRKSEATILDELLFQKIRIRERDGNIRDATVYEGVLRRFAEESLKGNIKAAAFLFARYAAANSGGQEKTELSADDKAIIEAFAKDLLAKSDGAD